MKIRNNKTFLFNAVALFDAVSPYCEHEHDFLLNGEVSCSEYNDEYSECLWVCKEGFQLIGENSTVCEEDESGNLDWTNPAPKCLRE